MYCYGDQTFCVSLACINKCNRKLTKEIEQEAIAAELPLSVAYFCNEDGEPIECLDI